MLKREMYLKKLQAFRDKQIIKVLTGMRRSGKSVLLQQFMEYLRADGVAADHIIFLNFEDINNQHLLEYRALYAYLQQQLTDSGRYYIFLDEIQQVEEFQRVVDSLFLQSNMDIYLTGSNAYMLSGELATLLSGRYVEIKVYPFSFAEYAACTGLPEAEAWQKFMLYGGFPFLAGQQDENIWQEYLSGIFNTVLLKDVVARHKVRDVKMLESVVKFLFDSIGNPISVKKIADTMTSAGRKVSSATIEGFIQALQEAFILYKADRYDIKGKLYLKTLGKYYVSDQGLRRLLVGDRYRDFGHVLENIVYLELLRRGYSVYVGKCDNLEIDFVAEKAGTVEYYQVSASVLDPQTYAREITPLQKIADYYPKYLLVMDELPGNDNGIQIINIRRWLMN